MSSSSDQVLRLPELLEIIFSHLDQRTLLTSAQRVNKRWHRIINHTKSIQQALFLQPIAATSTYTPTRNPLLAEVFSPWFLDHKDKDADEAAANARNFGDHEGSLHPMSVENLPIAKLGRREALLCPGASWRRMLVRQPPIHILRDQDFTRSCEYLPPRSRTWRYDEGLHMGEFYDMFFESDFYIEMCSFWNEPPAGQFDDNKDDPERNASGVEPQEDKRQEKGDEGWPQRRPAHYKKDEVDLFVRRMEVPVYIYTLRSKVDWREMKANLSYSLAARA